MSTEECRRCRFGTFDQPCPQSPLTPQAALESCHLPAILLVIIAKQV
jgi:hypothetical protein